ncbi:MAG: permease [Tepidisphaeraceae bacterium]
MNTDTPAQVLSAEAAQPPRKLTIWHAVAIGLLAAAVWVGLFVAAGPVSRWLTCCAMNYECDNQMAASLKFFLFETPRVLLLLVAVVFVVGIIRTFFSPQRTRAMLAGRRQFAGNILAAMLGIVTPFCSCSAVPLFIGFVTSGVPLGVTFSFLVAAPMVNEVALVLLFGMFGWKVALFYLLTGEAVAILSGWIIGRLGMEKHVEPWVYETKVGASEKERLIWSDRIADGWIAVKEIVGKVWLYVVAGIAVGAAIHGYVPEGLLASFMGKRAWWAVPLAVLLGKGAALGTVLAFMMSVIGLSLPEAVILRKVLKPRLIVTFFGIVATGILIVGYLFNYAFAWVM